MEQQIRFCTASDGVRIAYAVTGNGPPLVKTAHWLTHLQFDLESPIRSHWIKEFSKHHRFIRYDDRGSGLSDWEVDDFSFESWVHDLETIVDFIGLDQFSLLGTSQGGSVSIAYAVRHPERVKHLIIYGSYARGWAKRNSPPEELEEIEAEISLARRGWGRDNPAFRQIFTSQFIPDATLEQMRAFNDLQRVSTSPENAARFLTTIGNIDVLDLLPKVSVPTLVLHVRNDARVPFELGREMAALIPNARLVPLEGRNHVLLEEDPAWRRFLSEVGRFLGTENIPEGTGMEEGERRLSAIMFTDVVGYTSLTEKNELLARQLLEEHRNLLRPVFQLHNGKEVKTVGDMFLVEFASALEAVKCAIQIQKSLSKRNLQHPKDEKISLRVGIHMGEVEHSQGDVYGDAVNVASRVEALAEPSGIVVTRPVYEQIRNRPEIKMQSIGNRKLRNVREPLELFTLSH